MRRFISVALASCLLAFGIGSLLVSETQGESKEAQGFTEATEAELLEHVPTITKIDYAVEEINPPNLVVTALGKVPTGGWKQVQLVRRIYITPPADGMWEYDLLGVPPKDPATQVETAVKGTNRWKKYDQSIKGVRVYGIGRGAKELKFGEKPKK